MLDIWSPSVILALHRAPSEKGHGSDARYYDTTVVNPKENIIHCYATTRIRDTGQEREQQSRLIRAKDETKIPLCNVSERIPCAVNPFNVLFL